MQLVQRNPRRFVLTEAGQDYAAHCQSALDALGQAETSLANASPRGVVRASVPVLLAQTVLAPVLAGFAARHPQVVLLLDTENRKVDLIGEGFDFVVRVGEVGGASLIVRTLFEAEQVLCASPAYVQARGLPDTPEALAGHAVVACTKAAAEGATTVWRLSNGEDQASVVLCPSIRVNDPGSALALARAGAGIACVRGFVCQADERAGDLVHLLPGWAFPPVPVRLVLPARRAPSAAARVLVEAIYAARLDEALIGGMDGL